MFAVGIVLALAWSAVSQFLLPLRGTREFGLDRGGVSGLLMLAQLVDLAALLPVGRLADGLERDRLYHEMTRLMEVDTVWLLADSRIRNALQQPHVVGFTKHPVLHAEWLYLDLAPRSGD